MAQGAALGVVPMRHEVTTQQAADLLTISRPSLIKLLDAQALPYERSRGGHRRIRFADVLAYKQRRSETRRAALADIARMGQSYGAYDAHNNDLLFGIDAGEASTDGAG